MLPNSVSLNVKWHFCLFSTSELNDDKWYLYLCISLGFCFGVALIFWKLWTTKHVSVILLWTMMLAAVMLLLWSLAKKKLEYLLDAAAAACLKIWTEYLWIFVTSLTVVVDLTMLVISIGGECVFGWKYHFYVCSDLQITFIHMFRLADHCYLFHIRKCWNARVSFCILFTEVLRLWDDELFLAWDSGIVQWWLVLPLFHDSFYLY